MSDWVADRLHQQVLERVAPMSAGLAGGRRRKKRSSSRSRKRSSSRSSRGSGLVGGRRRSRSRGRGMSGGKRGETTSQFTKAVNALVRLGRGSFDKRAAEEAALAQMGDAKGIAEDLGLVNNMERVQKIVGAVPTYFWKSAKAKKMYFDIQNENEREDEQFEREDAIAKVMNTLDWETVANQAGKGDAPLASSLAALAYLKGRGLVGGRRRKSRSRSRGRGMSGGTRWTQLVKKHKGDMAAAKREYYGKKRSSSRKKRSSSRGRGMSGGRKKRSSSKKRFGKLY